MRGRLEVIHGAMRDGGWRFQFLGLIGDDAPEDTGIKAINAVYLLLVQLLFVTVIQVIIGSEVHVSLARAGGGAFVVPVYRSLGPRQITREDDDREGGIFRKALEELEETDDARADDRLALLQSRTRRGAVELLHTKHGEERLSFTFSDTQSLRRCQYEGGFILPLADEIGQGLRRLEALPVRLM